jgi:hypothetical protein
MKVPLYFLKTIFNRTLLILELGNFGIDILQVLFLSNTYHLLLITYNFVLLQTRAIVPLSAGRKVRTAQSNLPVKRRPPVKTGERKCHRK